MEKFKLSLLLLALFVCAAATPANKNKVQTVVYRENEGLPGEGTNDFMSSSSMEDIPPRSEWFRVHGDERSSSSYPNSNRNFPQVKPQMVSNRRQDIVILPPPLPKRVVGNAVVSSSSSPARQSVTGRVEVEQRHRNNDQMQVRVRNHGKVGFQQKQQQRQRLQLQSMRNMKNNRFVDSAGDNRQEVVFTRRIGGDNDDDYYVDKVEEIASPPPTETGNKKNLQQKQTGRTKSSIESFIDGSQQQPSEPGENDFIDDGRNRNIRREDGDRNVQGQQNADSRTSPSDIINEDEIEYEYDDMNDSRSIDGLNNKRKPSPKPKKALPMRNPPGQSRILQTSHNNNRNHLNDKDPPPHEQVAKMARYIVRNSNWTSVATISTLSPVQGYPFANVFSMSDGPSDDSSGVPYMYLTPLDMSAKDVESDPRASLTMSLAQGEYCREQQYDPEDPRCAHVILSGRILHVTDPDELEFARNALYSKHPDMQDWPKDHGWFFAKMDIEHIIVLDFFGGGRTVKVEDYFNV